MSVSSTACARCTPRRLRPDADRRRAVTQELDQVYIYLNKRNPKEAQSWLSELMQQGVSAHVLHCLGRDINEQHDQAARAKRAVLLLAYVSDRKSPKSSGSSLDTGGPFDGAAGPVRSVASRTCDLSAPPPECRILHQDLVLGIASTACVCGSPLESLGRQLN